MQYRKEYHFSLRNVLSFSLFIVFSIAAFAFLVFSTIKVSIILAVLQILLATWVLMFILPQHVRFTYYLLIKRPALILSQDSLLDNINGHQYKWSDIKGITYRKNEGIRTFGGFIAIDIKESENAISGSRYAIERLRMKLLNNKQCLAIPYKMIDCTKEDFLSTLNNYHQAGNIESVNPSL